jgi:hypothetical protein
MVARRVVPAPQGGRLWRLKKCDERDGGRRRHRQGRPTATNGEKRAANIKTLSTTMIDGCLVHKH